MRVACQQQRPRRRLPAWLRQLGIGLLGVGAGALLVWWPRDGRATIDRWLLDAGHHRVDYSQSTLQALLAAPPRLLSEVPAPHLELEIGFRGIETLRAQQADAVQRGRIDAADKREVGARLNVAGRRSDVRVRLKGDKLDHVVGPKVSFRIAVEPGERPVLGLHEFSVQAPPTKGFQLEALFHASVRWAGVMSPRYEFVRLGCNGTALGVMAFEEHCAKQLLERQGRREGVVVRFVEDRMFEEQARLGTVDALHVAFDDYRTAALRAFAEAEIAANPLLVPQREAALGLLRGFITGTLSASQAFDVDELARYLAICELWGSWHALRWHNLRFHYDSVRARLVPIGFDGNLHMRRQYLEVVTPREPITRRMIADASIYKSFRAHLRTFAKAVVDGPLLDELRRVEAQVLPLLQTDYPLLAGFPFQELVTRARYFLDLGEATLQVPPTDPGLVPVVVVRDGPNSFQLMASSAEPTHVHALRWRWPDGRVAAQELPGAPLLLPGKPAHGAAPTLQLAPLPPPADDAELEVEARLDSIGVRHWVRAERQVAARGEPVLPRAEMDDVLRRHRFLARDDDAMTLRVAAGRHEVQGDLLVPEGVRLVAGPGTQLLFAPDAMLLAQGPVEFVGSAASPCELLPREASFRGVVVLADAQASASLWRHVRVGRTSGIERQGYALTGGVVFHRGRVTLEHVEFLGTSAEDALNVIRAELSLQHARFADTVSDAFDGDFVTGEVADCEFTRIQGDAVDVSGARVRVRDCRMSDVRDKALSVGEGSTVDAKGLRATRVGVGAACKDASSLTLRDAEIAAPGFAGVMAYEKKPEFGPSTLHVEGLRVLGDAPRARAQQGSTLTVDGVRVPGEPIDIDLLYQTVMRKR